MAKTQTEQFLEDFLAKNSKEHKAIWDEVSEEMETIILEKEAKEK